VANRRITELPAIQGVALAEEDLLTLVRVFEVDPTSKNKKITLSEFGNYLSTKYLTVSGGTVTGPLVVTNTLTVGDLTTLNSVTATGLATFSGVFVENNLTVTGTISGTTITGTTINTTNAKFQNLDSVSHQVEGNLTVSGDLIAEGNAFFSSGVTVTGDFIGSTISGVTSNFSSVTADTVVVTTLVSGATVTGNIVNATSGVFQTLTAFSQAFAGNLTFSGDTFTLGSGYFSSGVSITGAISGITITGSSVQATNITGVTVVGTTSVSGALVQGGTSVSGATVTGNSGQFSNLAAVSGVFTEITGGTAGFTTLTGVTVTGTTANFITLSGTTVTGNTGQFNTITGNTAGFTTVTGVTVTGTTANFATVSGTTLTGNTGQFTTATGSTASFTSGNFNVFSGGVCNITSGVFAVGSASNPSITFASDLNTGIYKSSADELAFTTNGQNRLILDVDGQLEAGSLGSASLPAFTFSADSDTGIYSPGADELAITTAGVEKVNFKGSSEVVFNDGGANYDFRVEGDTKANLLLVDASADSVSIDGGFSVTGDATVGSLNSGPLAGFRNFIINGNFDIWQRGTSQTLSTTSDTSYYVADRWLNYFNGTGGVRTVSRQTFTNGQTDVPGNPAYFFRFGQTTAPTGCTLNAITQRIESVRTFAGQQFTFSFWAKAASAFTLLAVAVGQDFGNGGSPSPQTFTNFLNISISTTWTKYTFTATLPSISGKTLGTDGNDHISVNWFCPTSSTFTLDIAQVQLERGPIATDFEQRPIGTELALCQRYFCKSYEINTAPGTSEFDRGNPNSLSPASLDSLPCNVSFPVTMRSSPSVTIYRPSTGDVGTVENSVQTGPITVANVETGSTGIGLLVLNANSPAVGISYQFQYTASAEI